MHVASRSAVLLLALMLSAIAADGVSAQEFPVDDTITEYRHKGTFYHDRFEGRKTSSGEVFDQNAFSAAHWKIKLGTYLLVTNENTGLQVIVKVNDRCPKHGVLDLSHRAATAIGIRGCQPVRLRLLPEGYEDRCLAQDARFDSVYSRLHPAPHDAASVAEAQTVESAMPAAPKTANVAKAAPKTGRKTAPAKADRQQETCFRIILGTVASHADAYSMIRMLPDIYQDSASVEVLDDSNELLVYLDLHVRKDRADDLCRALKRTFPHVRLTTCS